MLHPHKIGNILRTLLEQTNLKALERKNLSQVFALKKTRRKKVDLVQAFSSREQKMSFASKLYKPFLG